LPHDSGFETLALDTVYCVSPYPIQRLVDVIIAVTLRTGRADFFQRGGWRRAFNLASFVSSASFGTTVIVAKLTEGFTERK
jgi:hypothetical protein